MRIEVLYVPGCRNYQPAVDRVKRVLASESVTDEVHGVSVTTEAAAKALLFPGSPTVRVNGKDVEPKPTAAPGLACRLYSSGKCRRVCQLLIARHKDRGEKNHDGNAGSKQRQHECQCSTGQNLTTAQTPDSVSGKKCTRQPDCEYRQNDEGIIAHIARLQAKGLVAVSSAAEKPVRQYGIENEIVSGPGIYLTRCHGVSQSKHAPGKMQADAVPANHATQQ